jgi:hypothetical protein
VANAALPDIGECMLSDNIDTLLPLCCASAHAAAPAMAQRTQLRQCGQKEAEPKEQDYADAVSIPLFHCCCVD